MVSRAPEARVLLSFFPTPIIGDFFIFFSSIPLLLHEQEGSAEGEDCLREALIVVAGHMAFFGGGDKVKNKNEATLRHQRSRRKCRDGLANTWGWEIVTEVCESLFHGYEHRVAGFKMTSVGRLEENLGHMCS